jgi:hypothetical protein
MPATTDRACPLGFILAATFVSVLIWIFALDQHLPLR